MSSNVSTLSSVTHSASVFFVSLAVACSRSSLRRNQSVLLVLLRQLFQQVEMIFGLRSPFSRSWEESLN